MPVPPYGIPPPPTYIDGEGRPHYITQDGLPPNNGVPPPPEFRNPPYIVYGTPPAPPGFTIYPPPIDATPPPPSYTEDGRVYFTAPHSTATEPRPTPAPPIQPLQTSSFRPNPPPAEKYIHVNFIRDSVRPHRDRFTGRDRDSAMPYTLTKVAINMKMKDLILIMGQGDLHGITECKTSADGRSWSEVKTFQTGDDESQKSLEELGWTDSKGTIESPIWVCIYRAGLEEEEERTYWEQRGFPAS